MQCLRCFITSYFAWNTAITVHWHCELYHLALNLGNVDILGILAMALLFWERYPWREYICSKLLLGIEGAITFVTDYHTTYMMCSIFLHCSVVITFLYLQAMHNKNIPLAVFGTLSLLAGAAIFLLPQTTGLPLPETLEDGEMMWVKRW